MNDVLNDVFFVRAGERYVDFPANALAQGPAYNPWLFDRLYRLTPKGMRQARQAALTIAGNLAECEYIATGVDVGSRHTGSYIAELLGGEVRGIDQLSPIPINPRTGIPYDDLDLQSARFTEFTEAALEEGAQVIVSASESLDVFLRRMGLFGRYLTSGSVVHAIREDGELAFCAAYMLTALPRAIQ